MVTRLQTVITSGTVEPVKRGRKRSDRKRVLSILGCALCGDSLMPESTCIMDKHIDTTWELRTYDVWGNATDGYEVNDSFRSGEVTIRCKVEVNNAGTPQEFLSASPSDSQIRRALSLRRFKLETDGDDLTIYVNRARDGYPLGELYCTSHDSLSPIRAKRSEEHTSELQSL